MFVSEDAVVGVLDGTGGTGGAEAGDGAGCWAFEAGVRKASDRDYELMSTFFTHPSHNAHLTVYFEGYSHDPPATVCGYIEGAASSSACGFSPQATTTIATTTTTTTPPPPARTTTSTSLSTTTTVYTTTITPPSTTTTYTTCSHAGSGHHTPTVTSGLEFRFLDNTDPGKFMAQVDLPIPHPMNGWTVHLLFDKPLYSLQGLEENVRKVNEYEFVLTSMNSNSHEISKIPIIFQANATGELPTRVWDDRLAEVAAKRARQCVLEHEANDSQRAMPAMTMVITTIIMTTTVVVLLVMVVMMMMMIMTTTTTMMMMMMMMIRTNHRHAWRSHRTEWGSWRWFRPAGSN
nr:hypothetical protein BaRGS_002830 [Batillaria attramentaria]